MERSKTHPVIIFKHSTQCAISDQVYEEFSRFLESAGNIICGLVLVIEWRAVSNAIESILTVITKSLKKKEKVLLALVSTKLQAWWLVLLLRLLHVRWA